jgi:hypothetical protein
VTTVTLFRPVGDKELELVADSGWRSFPPRLPEQIAKNWNSQPRWGGVGHVLSFDVPASATARWPVQIAGGQAHEELWVPSEELDAFNEMIVGPIRHIATYRDGARDEEAQ